MINHTRSVSVMRFEKNWLPWIVLRHFLPASCIRSLCETMVHDMSAGQLSLKQLVEERLGGGDAFMESWIIRPKICSSQLAIHLQQYVQRIVWQNDEDVWSAKDSIGNEESIPSETLQFAFNLGRCDLLNVIEAIPKDKYIQTDLMAVYDGIVLCASLSDVSNDSAIEHFLTEIDEVLIDVSPQLRIATCKHLGDLFCDRDQWRVAAKLYENAKAELKKLTDSERLSDFSMAIKVAIDQSIAASATVTHGYGAGQKMLSDLLESRPLEHTMVLANAGLDEHAARIRSSEEFAHGDTRSAMLIAPLLAESHTTENAFTSWRLKKFTKAEAWFWSTLRRQTALGLITASKSTKGHFASCLIEDLTANRSYDAKTFKLAIGLLIESESAGEAKEIRWSEDLLDACVDHNLCQFVIDHTEAYAGVRNHRRIVTILLFTEWASDIGTGRGDIAALMLHYLIRIGSELNTSVLKNGADFRTCFGAVLEVCKRRPELRVGIRDELEKVLAGRIGSTGHWTGEDIALRLALEFAPVFTEEGLKQVVSSVVAQLEKTDPSHGNWVIVRPAIQLLGEKCVGSLGERDAALGCEILRQLLKFGGKESDGTYAADIIFALNSYPPLLLRNKGIEDQYQLVIGEAINKASAINASNAVNFLMSLLVAPRAAGQRAIASVLQILETILESGVAGKSALSFGAAYTPVRYLVAYSEDICRESTIPKVDFYRSLAELCEKLKLVWHTAIMHPEIFAPLALLRKMPAERAIVHNWVVASLELAEAVGQAKEMVSVIELARVQDQFIEGISLGFATRHASGAQAEGDVVKFMSTESRGSFYAAIGRRLSSLHVNENRLFTRALLENTLRHGPRQVDAAVFVSIFPSDIDNLKNLMQELEDYKARIGEKRDLSLTLMPLLDRWLKAARD